VLSDGHPCVWAMHLMMQRNAVDDYWENRQMHKIMAKININKDARINECCCVMQLIKSTRYEHR